MRRSLLFLALAALAADSTAQEPQQYPEGAAIPRSLTPAERRTMDDPSYAVARAVTPPPSGPLHCVAEYEPMEAILIAWEGSTSWKSILAQMAARITTIGDADVYCAVDFAAEASSAASSINAAGADMGRVFFPVVATDSIWIRDYGPRYVYQGQVRTVIDHTYNRPRPLDNAFPAFYAGYRGQPLHEHPLAHGGGNFHLDALGDAYITRLINNENPGYSEAQIHGVFADYQNLDTTFFNPLPTSVDATQHIDMWLQVLADDAVMISDWPAQSGSTQDLLCDAAAVEMAARGYAVHRIPARAVSGTHYTYTNVVMCNDLLLIPSYTNAFVSAYNSQALAAWQAACPGKTVVQIPSQAIVTAAGVLHCIVMHVPAHLGGSSPTAYLVGPNAGAFQQGEQVGIEWVSDDDEGATSADLLLSTDGGQTFPTTIAGGLAPAGSYAWTVPALNTDQARLRVLVRDGSGNTGFDDSDADFSIGNPDLAALIPYGAGKAGTLGVPVLDASADPVLGTTVFLTLANGLPNGTAFYIRGDQPDSRPFDGATVLVDYTRTYQRSISGAGNASLTGNVPNRANLAGVSLYWQVWIRNDPAAAGNGWACSNGLETRLGY